MKLCPECELNFIDENADFCSVCKTAKQRNSSYPVKSRSSRFVNYDEDFTFTGETAYYKRKYGYKAYNSKGDNVGIVYMTDDKRSPSYEYCELCFYSEYKTRYGEWHRFFTNGCKLKWATLCSILKTNSEYVCHID